MLYEDPSIIIYMTDASIPFFVISFKRMKASRNFALPQCQPQELLRDGSIWPRFVILRKVGRAVESIHRFANEIGPSLTDKSILIKCREIKPGSRSIFLALLSHDNAKRIASELTHTLRKCAQWNGLKTKMITRKKFVKKLNKPE